MLVGECLQIIIRFFRYEVAKKRQGNRGNVENNVKILAIAVLIVATVATAAQAEPRQSKERNQNYILRRQEAGLVSGVPTTRRIIGKREIDVYRNGLMFERDHVVGVCPDVHSIDDFVGAAATLYDGIATLPCLKLRVCAADTRCGNNQRNEDSIVHSWMIRVVSIYLKNPKESLGHLILKCDTDLANFDIT